MSAEDGEGIPSPPSVVEVSLAGPRTGRPLRQIAADVHDRERAEARRDPDGWMRAKRRWLLRRAAGQAGR